MEQGLSAEAQQIFIARTALGRRQHKIILTFLHSTSTVVHIGLVDWMARVNEGLIAGSQCCFGSIPL